MSTYPADESAVKRTIRLSPESRGSANKSPEMYWDETSPRIANVPLCRRPESVSGAVPRSADTPFGSIARSSSASGRVRSPPRAVNDVLSRSAAATGKRNRSVEPLSMQSSVGTPTLFPSRGTGVTTMPSPPCENFAPRAESACIVARTSSHDPAFSMRTGASDSAAQIKSRCASDLALGASIAPQRAEGVMRAFIRHAPPIPRRRNREARPSGSRKARICRSFAAERA